MSRAESSELLRADAKTPSISSAPQPRPDVRAKKNPAKAGFALGE
ncbi:MAG TPA: hypothetical protein PKO07_03630 [Pseudomonadota bacterium]|nr:hypothetical protein [Pseudomonadota bacterium]